MSRLLHLLTLVVLSGLLAPVATAQEALDGPATPPAEPAPSAEELAEAQEAAQAAAAFEVPADVSAAVDVSPKDMREVLAAASLDKLTAVLGDWLALVRTQQQQYEAAVAAPEGSEARGQADALGTDRDALIARAETVIALLVERGGDVEQARATIKALRDAEARQALSERQSTVPLDQTQAQTVDVEILKAQLRPLRVEQVEEELADWMELLQKKCLEVRKAEVAGLRTEEADEIEKFNAAAVSLRTERDSLLRRVRVVIDAFEDKHGDPAEVEEHRAFVDSVVARPQVSGVRATWTTFKAWLVNPEGGIALGLNVVRFLVIVVGFKLLAALLAGLLNRALRAVGRTPELLRAFFVNALHKSTTVVGLIVALGQVGVDIGPLIAAIGGAAFVIGFALQGTLSNFAAGMMILMYRPYNVGDVVEIGGTSGKVAGQNMVSTTINTFDNKVVIVPNNMIWGDVITNATASTTRRVDMVFGIGYGDDIARADGILRDVLASHPKVLADPEPMVHVHELGDSSVNFIVRPWVSTQDYWDVYWAVTRAVKERFDAEGVSIPFPQRDVHVFQEQPPAPAAARDEPDRTPAGV